MLAKDFYLPRVMADQNSKSQYLTFLGYGIMDPESMTLLVARMKM